MTLSQTAPADAPLPPIARTDEGHYQPGVCNIGPAEIARRRRAGHVGALIAIALLVVLVVLDVPPLARLIVALPAAGAASGHSAFRFCAGFASRGLFNFSELGQEQSVGDPASRARDKARANQILIGSVAIGLAVGVIAVLLPL